MAGSLLGDGRSDSRVRRRQQAPALDVMAAQSSAGAAIDAETAEPGLLGAVPESRSSSSTSSPLPNDNEESDFFPVPNDSSSSICASNLQDMQVADDTLEDVCMPPVNRLPNEILIAIFAKLSSSADLLHCMLACKRWSRNSVDLLWHRPACTNWSRHESICKTLGLQNQYYHYKDFIKRLNLASIAEDVNDGSVLPLSVCNRVERLTLTNCKRLTDTGLIPLVENSNHLLALDISGDDQITEATIFAMAEHCKRLQGLNVSGCINISNKGMIRLAESCKYIKRIKLNDCNQLTDDSVLAFANNCPNILEIDLHQCRLITNQPVTSLLVKGQSLRELRLTNCELIDDGAFLSLPEERIFEHLRILDLTSCVRLTDRAVDCIIKAAPRLRNLVLAKCRNITDAAVHSIAQLGKNLHYVHLGHCNQITDESVKRLVLSCNRIRYIDLGCCVNLTDDSVTRLANLPKLKRIGLVKCNNITDESVFALAKANLRHRQRRDADGNVIENHYSHSSLERVHLSYCTNLSIRSIIRLLNACHRLTHLSLTGVPAFLREDLNRFCRSPPPEFTMHQQEVFCVFSGDGVSSLRDHLNTQPGYATYRDRQQMPVIIPSHRTVVGPQNAEQPLNAFFQPVEGAEVMVPEDDDGIEDGSEMIIDHQQVPQNVMSTVDGPNNNIPPPPPPPPLQNVGTFPASTIPSMPSLLFVPSITAQINRFIEQHGDNPEVAVFPNSQSSSGNGAGNAVATNDPASHWTMPSRSSTASVAPLGQYPLGRYPNIFQEPATSTSSASATENTSTSIAPNGASTASLSRRSTITNNQPGRSSGGEGGENTSSTV